MTEQNQEWVTVFSSINMVHAGMVRGFLESHDIPVMLRDEHVGSLQIPVSLVIPIKVQVQREKEVEAAELLKQLEINEMHSAGSRNWAKFYLPLYAVLVATIVFIIIIGKCS